MIQILYQWSLFHSDDDQNNGDDDGHNDGEPNIIDEGNFMSDEDEQGANNAGK